jgi:hypothetical protein
MLRTDAAARSRALAAFPDQAVAGRAPKPAELAAAGWDRDAALFDDVTYDQTAAYCEPRWGRGRTPAVSVASGAEMLGMARAVEFRLPALPGGLAYVKFGPLWRRAGARPDAASYRGTLAALEEEFCRRRGRLLTIMPRPDPDFSDLEADILREHGYEQRRPMLDPLRYFVDVRLDPSEQRASLGQKWRYHLRKANASELTVGIERGPVAIDAFRKLHGGMLRRKQFDGDHAVRFLDHLSAALPPALRPTIVLARKDGRAVAGAVVEHCGSIATYVFGASSSEGLELRAGYALQWWIVGWLHALEKRWYDLGGGAGEPNLEQFKRGLCGKSGCILKLPGEFDKWSSRRARRSGDLIYRARDLHRWARGLDKPAFLRRLRNAVSQ